MAMSEGEYLPRKYRSDVEIFYEIVRAVVAAGERGIKKTHLMYRTNLNSKMLAKYLDVLIKAKALEELEYRKEKIIRLGPNGMLAYVSLENINRVFYGAMRTDEESFVIEQLNKLKNEGWTVEWDFTVIGRLEVPILVDGFLSKGEKKYLLQMAVNRTEVETKIALLNLYLSLADTSVKGIFITDLVDTFKDVISPAFQDRLIVISAKPLEGILERVKAIQ
jgi:predicted transcriptional regulator